MAVTSARARGPPECVVIQEIYEHEAAQEDFEVELDRALEAKAQTIIIEPTKLGDETARWITVGNCLHKSAVLCGIGSFVIGSAWPSKSFVYLPMGCLSVVCCAVYDISWQFDPCCQYQVATDPAELQKLPLYRMTSNTPVVLARKDDSRRKILHNVVSLMAAIFCGCKVYNWYFQ